MMLDSPWFLRAMVALAVLGWLMYAVGTIGNLVTE